VGDSSRPPPDEPTAPARVKRTPTDELPRLDQESLPSTPVLPPRQSEAELPPGTAAGRYVVLQKLGEGGVGLVFAAWDPKLDRKVAIKLLRSEADASANSSSGQTRLLREAQAMARLKHANVLPVYDVGTLELKGSTRVFMAMELVDGGTLRAWLKQPHPRRAVLAALVAAGRGLAAAHAAGMVHRDFKPDNVLVDGDGRVFVTDFGLVRSSTAPEEPSSPGSTAIPSALETPMTREGTVLGTPAYMAPEQHRAERADARSDQFSFCISLAEALTGERPSVKREASWAALRKLPRWLARIVERGLKDDPAERWPDMDALLRALERDPAQRLRRIALPAAVLLLLVGAAWVGQRASRRQALSCRGAGQRLAGVWDPSVRARVGQAFGAAGAGGAVWTSTRDGIDRYAAALAAMHAESCEATRVRGEQPESVMALRLACLDARENELAALTSLWTGTVDRALAEKAPEAVAHLVPIARCADVPALAARVPPPVDPSARRTAEALRHKLARAKALIDSARYAEARTLVDEVLAAEPKVGWAPLRGDALALDGKLLEQDGKMNEAESRLVAAVDESYAGHDDTRVASVATDLALFDSFWLAHHEDGHRWAGLARAAITRLGGSDELEADRRRIEAEIFVGENRADQAVATAEQALALGTKAYGERSLQTAPFHGTLGAAFMAQGDTVKSREAYQRQLGLLESLVGPEHLLLAMPLNNIALALDAEENHVEAEKRYRASLAILERSLGPDHPRVAITEGNIGFTVKALKHYDAAVLAFRRALDIFQRHFGDGYAGSFDPLLGMGESLGALERHSEAVGWLERALALGEKTGGAPTSIAEARFALADELWKSGGDRARALTLARSAKAAFVKEGSDLSKRALVEVDGWLAKHR
jgi:tetratricopeptide (TPR) repeat protein